MDKAKIFRIVCLAVSGAVGALITAGVIPAEPWAAFAAALGAWQIPALGHSAAKP